MKEKSMKEKSLLSKINSQRKLEEKYAPYMVTVITSIFLSFLAMGKNSDLLNDDRKLIKPSELWKNSLNQHNKIGQLGQVSASKIIDCFKKNNYNLISPNFFLPYDEINKLYMDAIELCPELKEKNQWEIFQKGIEENGEYEYHKFLQKLNDEKNSLK